MRILPRRTRPFPVKLERRHTPRPTRGRRGYQALRPCLRWELGFTCAFCLAHESDLAEHGAEGTGLMTVEHFSPASTANTAAEVEALVNEYRNCFYACRYCNGSRNDAPEVDRRGRKLLNPFSVAWGEHFVLSDDDRLLPVPGDLNAEYTAEVYDFNEARKLEMRRSRRERLDESSVLLDQGPGLLDALLANSLDSGPGARSAELLRAAESLRKAILAAEQSLIRHAAIPEDADAECRCGHPNHHSLPTALEDQTIEIDVAG